MSTRQDTNRFKDLGSRLTALKPTQPSSDKEPPAPKPKQRRHVSIHFRASSQEHDMLQQAAERMGLTVSSFVRLAVREKLGLVTT